jgi:TonB family protein
LAILSTILLSAWAASLVLGQGGTGRESSNTAKPAAKKTPPKKDTTKKPSPKQPSIKPTDSTPSFRPTNPGIELVRISSGTFMMGSTNGETDEKPAHQVTTNYSFYIGKYEVTQAQWQSVMGNNPSYFKDCANCPVEQVSWDDAQNFIKRLNESNDGFRYRLPTEAEWEYACRAGTTGDYAGNLTEMAWYYENSGSKTHAVEGKRSNDWGLADMHGNVLEWCEDWYHTTYDGAPTDGSAWLSGGEQKYRVVRGGSWPYSATQLRSAYRLSFYSPDYRSYVIGFRVVAVARTLPNSSSTTPTTVDADPVLFPKDTRIPQPGETKPKSSTEPVEEKVYAVKEVDQRARVLDKPIPFYTDAARTNAVSGTVVLRAVLASSGQVTNIRVISGLPHGLTERAIAAARKLKFTPAMKDGKPVSQYVQLEYNFSPY